MVKRPFRLVLLYVLNCNRMHPQWISLDHHHPLVLSPEEYWDVYGIRHHDRFSPIQKKNTDERKPDSECIHTMKGVRNRGTYVNKWLLFITSPRILEELVFVSHINNWCFDERFCSPKVIFFFLHQGPHASVCFTMYPGEKRAAKETFQLKGIFFPFFFSRNGFSPCFLAT